MQKSEKERVVAELTERLQGAETLIVADYRGLTVTQIAELREKLYEHGARFSVVKNSLTKRAAESAGVEPLLALLEGPTAIAFLESDGDPVAVAKALDDAVRTETITLKDGLLEGTRSARTTSSNSRSCRRPRYCMHSSLTQSPARSQRSSDCSRRRCASSSA